MKVDIRQSAEFIEANALYVSQLPPATETISDAAELCPSSKGSRILYVGSVATAELESPVFRICELDQDEGRSRILTSGPNNDKSPKYAPDETRAAFLSDRGKKGVYRLYLLNLRDLTVSLAADIPGRVEYFHWSQAGDRILLGVAGEDADIAGVGGVAPECEHDAELPAWMPSVEAEPLESHWRSAWVLQITDLSAWRVSPDGLNVWDCVWLGENEVAAITTPDPEEGSWYQPALDVIDIHTLHRRTVYKPSDQLGCLCGSRDGGSIAVVEALASDRGVVAGDLLTIEAQSAAVVRHDQIGADIAYVEWLTNSRLLYSGHRIHETVIGTLDLQTGNASESWASADLSTSGRLATVAGVGDAGDCVFVAEGFLEPPSIVRLKNQTLLELQSFDCGSAQPLDEIAVVHAVRWFASDGLDLHGWYIAPKDCIKSPVVLNIHGGPINLWRPHWLGRGRLSLSAIMLLRRGIGLFYANPRGSLGRGQAFAKRVRGDMGGKDTDDFLSGLDALVAADLVDAKRIGVTGGSYGGYMACWLVAHDERFAAAVPVAPITNHFTERLLSNIPEFEELFIDDAPDDLRGQYFTRSPVLHASAVKTPTLLICGGRDKCTPASEARQFHNALKRVGVETVLVEYPEEGHSVLAYPAVIDLAARIVRWFDAHLRLQKPETRSN